MAKQTGLGDNFYVAGRNFSNATNSLQRISSPRGSLEMTGVDKFAVERKRTVRDGAIDCTGYFDPETVAGGGTYDGAHSYYSTLPRTDVHVMYARGTTIGNPSAALIASPSAAPLTSTGVPPSARLTVADLPSDSQSTLTIVLSGQR